MLFAIVDINNGITELFHLLKLLAYLPLKLLITLECLVLLGHDPLEGVIELHRIVVTTIRHRQVIVHLEDRGTRILDVTRLTVLDRQGVIDNLHVQFDGSITGQLNETLELFAHRILNGNPWLS